MSLDKLAKATCAVFVAGRRQGTGTLVTDSHVLTAAHVLAPEGPVTVQFRDAFGQEPLQAERLSLDSEAEPLDIAVLELVARQGVPSPAELWPGKRLRPAVKVFGYPISEGASPRGVWRDLTVSGGVQGGRVQLDWREAGPLKGHSGGPVCEATSGLMSGVLVEGSDAGHFDRMIPLSVIRQVWKGLPFPWLFAGEGARAHFTQRAAGQQSVSRGGDLFRGRARALDVIRDWLCAPAGPGLPLVVTGQPGAGKSAVIARVSLEMERSGRYQGVSFHARGATVGGLVDAIAAACGLDTPQTWQELAEILAGQEAGEGLILAVDALDEAASERDVRELQQALRDLARLDWVRVVVATRRMAVRDHFRRGTHLQG